MSSLTLAPGSDAYVNIGTAVQWRSILNNHATSMWIKTLYQLPCCLLSLANDTYEVFSIMMNTEPGNAPGECAGGLTVLVQDTDGNSVQAFSTVPPLADDRWHLVEVEVVDNTVRFRVDGQHVNAQYTRRDTLGLFVDAKLLETPVYPAFDLIGARNQARKVSNHYLGRLGDICVRGGGFDGPRVHWWIVDSGAGRTVWDRGEFSMTTPILHLHCCNCGWDTDDHPSPSLHFDGPSGFFGVIPELTRGRITSYLFPLTTVEQQLPAMDEPDVVLTLPTLPGRSLGLSPTGATASTAAAAAAGGGGATGGVNATTSMTGVQTPTDAAGNTPRTLSGTRLVSSNTRTRSATCLSPREVAAATATTVGAAKPLTGATDARSNPGQLVPSSILSLAGTWSAGGAAATSGGTGGGAVVATPRTTPAGGSLRTVSLVPPPTHSLPAVLGSVNSGGGGVDVRAPFTPSLRGNAKELTKLTSRLVSISMSINTGSSEPAVLLTLPAAENINLLLNHDGHPSVTLAVGGKAHVARVNVCDNKWRQLAWNVDPTLGVSFFLDGQLSTWEPNVLDMALEPVGGFGLDGSTLDFDEGEVSVGRSVASAGDDPEDSSMLQYGSGGVANSFEAFASTGGGSGARGAAGATAASTTSTSAAAGVSRPRGTGTATGAGTLERPGLPHPLSPAVVGFVVGQTSNQSFLPATTPNRRYSAGNDGVGGGPFSPVDVKNPSRQSVRDLKQQVARSNRARFISSLSGVPNSSGRGSAPTTAAGSARGSVNMLDAFGTLRSVTVGDVPSNGGRSEDSSGGTSVEVVLGGTGSSFTGAMHGQDSPQRVACVGHHYSGFVRDLQLVLGEGQFSWPLSDGFGMAPAVGTVVNAAFEPTMHLRGRYAVWPKILLPPSSLQFHSETVATLGTLPTVLGECFEVGFFVRLSPHQRLPGTVLLVDGSVQVDVSPEFVQLSLFVAPPTTAAPVASSPTTTKTLPGITPPRGEAVAAPNNGGSGASAGDENDELKTVAVLMHLTRIFADRKWHFIRVFVPALGECRGVKISLDGSRVDLTPVQTASSSSITGTSSQESGGLGTQLSQALSVSFGTTPRAGMPLQLVIGDDQHDLGDVLANHSAAAIAAASAAAERSVLGGALTPGAFASSVHSSSSIGMGVLSPRTRPQIVKLSLTPHAWRQRATNLTRKPTPFAAAAAGAATSSSSTLAVLNSRVIVGSRSFRGSIASVSVKHSSSSLLWPMSEGCGHKLSSVPPRSLIAEHRDHRRLHGSMSGSSPNDEAHRSSGAAFDAALAAAAAAASTPSGRGGRGGGRGAGGGGGGVSLEPAGGVLGTVAGLAASGGGDSFFSPKAANRGHTLTNTFRWKPTRLPSMALRFNGKSSHANAIDVASVFPLESFNQFTVVVWVRDGGAAPTQCCVMSLHDRGSPSLEASAGIFLHTTVDPRSSPKRRLLQPHTTTFVLTDSCERCLALQITSDLTDGLWHKLEWRVSNARENKARIFVDDRAVDATVVCEDSPRDFQGHELVMSVGARDEGNQGVKNHFCGAVRCLRLHTDDVLALGWNMDEGVGTVLYDQTCRVVGRVFDAQWELTAFPPLTPIFSSYSTVEIFPIADIERAYSTEGIVVDITVKTPGPSTKRGAVFTILSKSRKPLLAVTLNEGGDCESGLLEEPGTHTFTMTFSRDAAPGEFPRHRTATAAAAAAASSSSAVDGAFGSRSAGKVPPVPKTGSGGARSSVTSDGVLPPPFFVATTATEGGGSKGSASMVRTKSITNRILKSLSFKQPKSAASSHNMGSSEMAPGRPFGGLPMNTSKNSLLSLNSEPDSQVVSVDASPEGSPRSQATAAPNWLDDVDDKQDASGGDQLIATVSLGGTLPGMDSDAIPAVEDPPSSSPKAGSRLAGGGPHEGSAALTKCDSSAALIASAFRRRRSTQQFGVAIEEVEQVWETITFQIHSDELCDGLWHRLTWIIPSCPADVAVRLDNRNMPLLFMSRRLELRSGRDLAGKSGSAASRTTVPGTPLPGPDVVAAASAGAGVARDGGAELVFQLGRAARNPNPTAPTAPASGTSSASVTPVAAASANTPLGSGRRAGSAGGGLTEFARLSGSVHGGVGPLGEFVAGPGAASSADHAPGKQLEDEEASWGSVILGARTDQHASFRGSLQNFAIEDLSSGQPLLIVPLAGSTHLIGSMNRDVASSNLSWELNVPPSSCLAFNGKDRHISVGSMKDFNFNRFFFTAVLRSGNRSHVGCLVNLGRIDSAHFAVMLNENAQGLPAPMCAHAFLVDKADRELHVDFAVPPNFFDNDWHSVTWRIDNAAENRVRIEVDGNPMTVRYGECGGPFEFDDTENGGLIAAEPSQFGPLNPFEGMLKRVEIGTEGNDGDDCPKDVLHGRWELNSGYGTVLTDSSGNRCHAMAVKPLWRTEISRSADEPKIAQVPKKARNLSLEASMSTSRWSNNPNDECVRDPTTNDTIIDRWPAEGWLSGANAPQWVNFDLGRRCTVFKIELVLKRSCKASFEIFVARSAPHRSTAATGPSLPSFAARGGSARAIAALKSKSTAGVGATVASTWGNLRRDRGGAPAGTPATVVPALSSSTASTTRGVEIHSPRLATQGPDPADEPVDIDTTAMPQPLVVERLLSTCVERISVASATLRVVHTQFESPYYNVRWVRVLCKSSTLPVALESVSIFGLTGDWKPAQRKFSLLPGRANMAKEELESPYVPVLSNSSFSSTSRSVGSQGLHPGLPAGGGGASGGLASLAATPCPFRPLSARAALDEALIDAALAAESAPLPPPKTKQELEREWKLLFYTMDVDRCGTISQEAFLQMHRSLHTLQGSDEDIGSVTREMHVLVGVDVDLTFSQFCILMSKISRM